MREMYMNGHNEAIARFLAYSSSMLFWVFISLLTAGIWWVQ
jgi:hypothetical protein